MPDPIPFQLSPDETLIAHASVRRYAPALFILRQQHHGTLYLTTSRIVFQRVLGGSLISLPLSRVTAAATEEIVVGRGMEVAAIHVDFDTGGAEYFIPNGSSIQSVDNGEYALSFASGEPTNQLARAINAARSKAPQMSYTTSPGPLYNAEVSGRLIIVFMIAVFVCLCASLVCSGILYFTLAGQSTYP